MHANYSRLHLHSRIKLSFCMSSFCSLFIKEINYSVGCAEAKQSRRRKTKAKSWKWKCSLNVVDITSVNNKLYCVCRARWRKVNIILESLGRGQFMIKIIFQWVEKFGRFGLDPPKISKTSSAEYFKSVHADIFIEKLKQQNTINWIVGFSLTSFQFAVFKIKLLWNIYRRQDHPAFP